MTFLKFLDTKELEEFATGLANDLARRFPPASESRTDRGAQHQIKVILEGLAVRAVRYKQEHKLGIYKKAKLGNVFRIVETERLNEGAFQCELLEFCGIPLAEQIHVDAHIHRSVGD